MTVTTPNGTSADLGRPTASRSAPGRWSRAISPAAGPLAGGTPVTISGTNFSGATDVYFGAVASRRSILRSTWPEPRSRFIARRAWHGDGGRDGGDAQRHVGDLDGRPVHVLQRRRCSPRSVPRSAPVAGSTPVTITGTGLAGATAVDFGANPATIVSDTDSQIVVLSPAASGGNPGPVNVTVTTA